MNEIRLINSHDDHEHLNYEDRCCYIHYILHEDRAPKKLLKRKLTIGFNPKKFPYSFITEERIDFEWIRSAQIEWIEENCTNFVVYDNFKNRETILWFQTKEDYEKTLGYLSGLSEE